MLEIKSVEMKRDRSLIDANFTGYKLSLESVHVAREQVSDGPVHLQPTSQMFGFLHAKIFGEHNHLFLDNYTDNRVFYISASGKIYTMNETGCPSEVWNIPETGQPHEYNPAVVFASESLALVSDGSGTLFIVDTGDRNEECIWRSVFQDNVCGKERPFVVRYGSVENEGKSLEVVLQYIEDPERMEVTALPSNSQEETSFFNCLEWITFSLEDKGWQMERVRRVVSHGGFNYVSVLAGSLAVSAEKKTVLSFDSLNPVETLDVEPVNQEQDEKPKFYWKQTDEDLEIWFYVLPDTVKSQVNINVTDKKMDVKISGVDFLQGEFNASVEQDSWTWTIDHGKIGVMMSKVNAGKWSSIWTEASDGVKGQEVTDLTEDTLLPHLTSENPVVSGDMEREPAFNTQELESVDDTMEENSIFVWQSDATAQSIASLSGNQHLMAIPMPGGQPPALCIRSDVDGLVLKVENKKLEHISTFPALGYVQAGKQNRKFLGAPHDFSYSAICDDSRHIYIYRQPKPIQNELRNRKTGLKVEGVAVQQVVTLDNREDILGLQATPTFLFLVTQHALYRITVN
eukprot:TRINITY_DN10655_c0_g2_i1.p1 TRINITY_DN10655_c0_g2~~TRINITY_DN10655_c0_g2_i1.p1  ORF type:complete len:571 (+),score=117.23 TRINITY_DN10655_c0_g2_i1:52-1764(+)